MKKATLMGLLVAAMAAATAFAPAANAGYHHHHYRPYYTHSYVYVPSCYWHKFHDHYGHIHYKKVCH